MRNIARLPDEERADLFRNTADKMKLHDAIIEKDFWVCFTLDYLFHRSPWKEHITFKDGTSLSKAFDMILDWQLLGYSKGEPSESISHADAIFKTLLRSVLYGEQQRKRRCLC